MQISSNTPIGNVIWALLLALSKLGKAPGENFQTHICKALPEI